MQAVHLGAVLAPRLEVFGRRQAQLLDERRRCDSSAGGRHRPPARRSPPAARASSSSVGEVTVLARAHGPIDPVAGGERLDAAVRDAGGGHRRHLLPAIVLQTRNAIDSPSAGPHEVRDGAIELRHEDGRLGNGRRGSREVQARARACSGRTRRTCRGLPATPRYGRRPGSTAAGRSHLPECSSPGPALHARARLHHPADRGSSCDPDRGAHAC